MTKFTNQKILVINNIYPPQELGGYGRYISDFANILREKGHQVKVLTSDAPYLKIVSDNEVNIDRNLTLLGSYEKLPPIEIQNQEELKLIVKKNNQYIEQIIKFFQPDVVLIGNIDLLSHYIFEPFLTYQIPIIHHVAFNEPYYPLTAKPDSLLYHLSACSHFVKNQILTQGYDFEDISVIYPGAYVDDFANLQLPEFDKLKLVFASIVMPYKGPQTLVKALAVLHHEGFDFDCVLAGTTPDIEFKTQLENFIIQNQMQDKVKLIGYQSRDTLIKLYQSRNVFVFPSVWDEPFGISQVEGMASGLTTITSATGGASEIVDHGISGLKFQKDNPLSLAFCFLRLLANREDWQKISQQGIKRAKDFFDIYHSVNLLEEKFAELILKNKNYSQWVKIQPDKIAKQLKLEYNLGQFNYLISPNWQSDEEALTMELSNLIHKLANYETDDVITLVIDHTNITKEETDLFFSTITMNLMLETELDLENKINFSFINNLNEQQWQQLIPHISARITLENENENAIAHIKTEENLISINGNGHNYVIFPDWKKDEETLFIDISQSLEQISLLVTDTKANLLVNINNIDSEEAHLFLSNIMMSIMLENEIENLTNLDIIFVNFNEFKWREINCFIQEKITLNNEFIPMKIN